MNTKQMKIANPGRVACPFYGGLHLPINSVYGVFPARYEYSTDDSGRTHKRIVKDKIPYYLTDFRPYFKFNKYSGKPIAVFFVNVFDISTNKWISTTTDSCARFFLLGEFIQKGLYFYFGNEMLTKKVAPENIKAPGHLQARVARPDASKGKAVYGYMCKSPDTTMTHYDLVGDAYAENRRLKK